MAYFEQSRGKLACVFQEDRNFSVVGIQYISISSFVEIILCGNYPKPSPKSVYLPALGSNCCMCFLLSDSVIYLSTCVAASSVEYDRMMQHGDVFSVFAGGC